MRPEIVTASADSTHVSSPSAMAEVHDNNDVDVHHIGELSVTAPLSPTDGGGATEGSGGMASQIWGGLLEDVFGRRKAV